MRARTKSDRPMAGISARRRGCQHCRRWAVSWSTSSITATKWGCSAKTNARKTRTPLRWAWSIRLSLWCHSAPSSARARAARTIPALAWKCVINWACRGSSRSTRMRCRRCAAWLAAGMTWLSATTTLSWNTARKRLSACVRHRWSPATRGRKNPWA